MTTEPDAQHPPTLPTLRTERLELRPASEADLGLLEELNSDPVVMRFHLDRAATCEETRAEWGRRLERQTDVGLGLGYWLGFESGAFVGWWGASWFAPDPSRSPVGYRLRRSAWGRGLATEGAIAAIGQAFDQPVVQSVEASTMAVNARSRRVLEKLGLTHVSSWTQEWDEPVPGAEHGEVGYRLTRGEWERRPTA